VIHEGAIMRRFGRVFLAIFVLSALGLGLPSPSPAPAQNGAVKAIFEKYDLLGMFAWDCSKPPDTNNNWFFVDRLLDADHVQRDFMDSPTSRAWFTIIDQASETGQGEISVSGIRDGQRNDSVWRIEKSRMLQWSAVTFGKPTISGGRWLATGKDMPWLNKCGALGTQGQISPGLSQISPGLSQISPGGPQISPGGSQISPGISQAQTVTVPSGVKSQITAHMSVNAQCEPYRVVIETLIGPTNGTLTTEPKNLVIPPETPRAGQQPSQCVGRTVLGVAIFYQSRAGYVGQDSFKYRRTTPERPGDPAAGDISYTVTVR
jgi:hypothetical protein